ncbi:MAG: hypothetical protein ACXAC2_06310, partial [Candidatus Kariarchaeaceae archaeon]
MNLLLDLVDAGKYNEALAEIDSLEYPETLEGEFWRIHISWYKFHSTDSIKIAESAIKLADDNDQPVWKLLYYLSGSIALIILREYDQALTWIDNLEELIDQLENHSEYKERESEVQQMYLA